MKLQIKNTPEQVALIQKMASKNKVEAEAAKELFAELLSPTLGQVLQEADTTKFIFEDMTYNENTDPTLPLELFQDVPEGYFNVWSQSMPGGLPTNNIYQPIDEVKFTTYRLDSAISYLKKYATQTRLDVVGKSIERLMQEIMLKIERNSWSVLLGAIANANNGGKASVVRAETAGTLTLDDINKLFTLIRRQNLGWAGGTPVGKGQGGLTDLVVSPEIMEFVRSMAYNPINTRAVLNTTPSAASPAVLLPDADRAGVFRGAGIQSLLGVNLIELVELGVGQKYNVLFDEMAGSNTYAKFDGSNAAAFDSATEEVLIGLNLSAPAFAHRAYETNSETGSTFTLVPDDQFTARSERIGFYGSVRTGNLITSTRPITALIV